MSIVLSTIASQQRISQTSDLQMKISEIKLAQVDLQRTVAELVDAGSDLDPKSPAAKQLAARREALQNLEKELELKLDTYTRQLETMQKSLGYIENLGKEK